jgi:hypothetical protein
MDKTTILYTKNTLLLILLITISSCSKDTPEVVNEEELITTIELNFSTQGEPDQTVRWETEAANSAEIVLKSNTEYDVQITFLDESDPSDIENINAEIIEEADEHQVFYEFSGVSVTYGQGTSDTLDSDQNPVYINSIWNTSDVNSGVVRVFLIHEPTTKSSTTRDGFGGETDVSVDIPIRIIEE